jgi:transcriptional repressor NrdR
MHCPFCSTHNTKVVDSRWVAESNQVRRRRECLHCVERFTTYETVELILPRVRKRDNSRTQFDENKIRLGLEKALEKRPISAESIEEALAHILHKTRAQGEHEISSALIGEWVMEELRHLDQVAYVRFASVYRSFQDVSEFRDTINNLIKETKTS